MLEHPQNLRTTRSGSAGYSRTGPSPPRGRGMRNRGGNRIQPIVWNQDQCELAKKKEIFMLAKY